MYVNKHRTESRMFNGPDIICSFQKPKDKPGRARVDGCAKPKDDSFRY